MSLRISLRYFRDVSDRSLLVWMTGATMEHVGVKCHVRCEMSKFLSEAE
jgi:hypothetical protein